MQIVTIADCVTGINSFTDIYSFVIFPNPVQSGDEIRIDLPRGKSLTIKISDFTGKLIMEKVGIEHILINTLLLEPGFYTVTASDKETFSKTTKLIVY